MTVLDVAGDKVMVIVSCRATMPPIIPYVSATIHQKLSQIRSNCSVACSRRVRLPWKLPISEYRMQPVIPPTSLLDLLMRQQTHGDAGIRCVPTYVVRFEQALSHHGMHYSAGKIPLLYIFTKSGCACDVAATLVQCKMHADHARLSNFHRLFLVRATLLFVFS